MPPGAQLVALAIAPPRRERPVSGPKRCNVGAAPSSGGWVVAAVADSMFRAVPCSLYVYVRMN